jgi:protein phosphatase inhibitor 2
MESSEVHHSPPQRPQQPRGILKNSFRKQRSPSPNEATPTKEITLINTNANAGPNHPAVTGRMPGSRRHSSREPEHLHDENAQRLKWDEANLYLTEQERTATMKINEPKTPYAKHYDPDEDPSDIDEPSLADGPVNGHHRNQDREIPDLSLGEPEDDLSEAPSPASSPKKEKAVHVDDTASSHGDVEEVGLSAEEKEKHRKFEELRKKHYEMKDVARLLGHAEGLEDEDEENAESTVPPLPNGKPVEE